VGRRRSIGRSIAPSSPYSRADPNFALNFGQPARQTILAKIAKGGIDNILGSGFGTQN
jgi:hypothetical protein